MMNILQRIYSSLKISNKKFLSPELQYKILSAEKYLNNKYHLSAKKLTENERQKRPYRYEIINFLNEYLNRETTYLEIGVRNLDDNFNKISANIKYSVDPGYEIDVNLADFKMTSDQFFEALESGNVLNKEIKFDIIFIDGLHLAEQVERDINNALLYLKDDGFLVLHDCNPPTEFHASENYDYGLSPSAGNWNGTTWKAFYKARKRTDIFSCCIDTDWGIGIICKHKNIGKPSSVKNDYYEYYLLNENRKESLNLISFEEFKQLL